MNAQKALEIIRYEVDEEGHCGYIENELQVAMTALEKQIPKKVVFGDDEQDYVLCPICKIELSVYCKCRIISDIWTICCS